MAQALSTTQPFRQNQILIGSGWRAFYAPYNQVGASAGATLGNTPIDFQVQGPFNQSAPPPGFVDMGQIKNFRRTPGTKIGQIRSGYRGAVRLQVIGEVGETFELSFMEMSRMVFKCATGSEMFNIITPVAGAAASQTGPLNASGIPAVPLSSAYAPAGATFTGQNAVYSNRPTLYLANGAGAQFPAGSLIVCDQDYNGTDYGQVGAAGINLFQGATTDVDFIRRTSDFVARVVAVVPGTGGSADALILDKPFIGGGANPNGLGVSGVPDPTSKVQLIKGYAVRGGGSYIADWSALFLMATRDGSQIAVYYPHASPNQFKDMTGNQIENAGTTELMQYSMDAVFTALAFDDPYDGETVVSYCAYFPAPRSFVNPSI